MLLAFSSLTILLDFGAFKVLLIAGFFMFHNIVGFYNVVGFFIVVAFASLTILLAFALGLWWSLRIPRVVQLWQDFSSCKQRYVNFAIVF